ncbi:MAG: glycosyltransferase family 4 protein [Thauera sp.]|nr:glycosyltransferase family 4 protein [Thauera sp.]
MKILFFIKGLGLGGAERHVVDCAAELLRRGHDVAVVYVLPNKNALVEELERQGVKVFCVGTSAGFAFGSLLMRLSALVRTFQPDVLHAHLPVPGIIARLLKLRHGYRLVYTEHNVYERLHPLTRIAHRLTHSLDDCAISCSGPVAASLPWKSLVIENGIRVPEEQIGGGHVGGLRNRLGIDGDAVVFICIANLLHKKNHALLVDSFERAFGDFGGSSAHLVLVGQDGTERAALEIRTRDFVSRRRIHFWGPHPNASELLAEADVFCLSSSFEGLPIALLESMAVGIPAVVTRVGGMPDCIAEGTTGFVVEPDDRDGFAEGMKRLYGDRNMRQRMGAGAYMLARAKFSQVRMMGSLAHCYGVEA